MCLRMHVLLLAQQRKQMFALALRAQRAHSKGLT